ncbi:MAG: DoxX family protein [bacterium]
MNFITELYIINVLQIILALGLINVWLVRFRKPTKYRGKGAANMEQEFRAYGLPTWFMYLIGAAKMIIAVLLVIGLWIPVVVLPAAAVLAVLMVGAVSMHIKVRDACIRMMPALLMLAMAVAVAYLAM